jgi:hypothetical protein
VRFRGFQIHACVAALSAGISMSGFHQVAPQAAAIRLIVQGDDMGAAHGINVATIEAYTHGILRSANVIVPGPWLPEAARLLRENPGIDAGVHLALTSEWSDVKWRPLTHAPSLVDEYGFFFPMVWPRADFPAQTDLKSNSPDIGEIERELRAQIELGRAMIPNVTYTWAHMGFSSLSPEVGALVERDRRPDDGRRMAGDGSAKRADREARGKAGDARAWNVADGGSRGHRHARDARHRAQELRVRRRGSQRGARRVDKPQSDGRNHASWDTADELQRIAAEVVASRQFAVSSLFRTEN